MNSKKDTFGSRGSISIWISALIPLLAIALLITLFLLGDPLALFSNSLPPIEELTFERIRITDDGFEATLINGGPDPVTISQVLVDEAYWKFEIIPSGSISRLGRATLFIPYPWVEYEAHEIVVITPSGATFSEEVPLSTPSPSFGWREFAAYGLIGVYVGVVPVVLGMLWYPAMKAIDRKWLGAILALTVGLLVFLLIDTLLEAFEIAAELPGFFQGIPLTLFVALLTWLGLLALGERQRAGKRSSGTNPGLYLASMIALGIGLHNLGEGLAIGAAFASGEASLGSFLVIGFMLHNLTEGIGIAAPLLPGSRPDAQKHRRVGLSTFAWLALLAGAPAIIGAWFGGFAFSPIFATIFLGIGLGAIWQVIVEVFNLLRDYADHEDTPLFSVLNVIGFSVGILIMYLTAFLVKF
ncbi:MAG: metal transporter [Anaerolineales bacterium]|nr:metal transporter [Chloroflexota bacterium]MBL6982532.1 metal transporter [Anaerolineales bacterium]